MQNGTAVKPNNGGGSPPPRELLAAAEAARFLGLPSESAIYHMKHRGQFNGFGVIVQIGRRTLYSISGLRKFIDAHRI